MIRGATQDAYKILAEVEKLVKCEDTQVFGMATTGKPKAVQEAFRVICKERSWIHRIKFYSREGGLTVVVKAISYTEKLEKMVRKLAMHCDDEALYEEAQALVKTI